MALDIRIIGAERVSEPDNHVSFQIQIRSASWVHTVEKRYSNFLELHRVMKIRHHLAPYRPLPDFPGKKLWKNVFGGLRDRDIADRQHELDEYMRLIEENPCAWDSQYFIEFLQLPAPVVRRWVQYHTSKMPVTDV